MKKTSIKTAILIPSLAVLIAGITIMAAVVGMLSSTATGSLTNQLIEAKVHENANEFRELCGEVYGAVAAATPIISNYIDPEFAQDVSNPRGEVTDILSKVLLSNDKIIGAWTCWEPGAFDGKDKEYAGTSFYDATGRFIPYVYRDGGGFKVEALVDYDDPVAGEYYQGARNTGKPYVTDPYAYSVGGTETFICSLAIPIIQNGKVAGVVGADINLQDFMTLMNSASILDDGYMFTLSPGGLFASHSKEELQMSSYKTTWMKAYSTDVEKALANGGSFSVNSYSDVINANITFLGSAVKIGATDRYWLVCSVIPEKTVNASSASLLWAIIAIGLALIAVVGATIFFIIRSRLKGMPKLTAIAESIAMGDIDSTVQDTGTEATRNEITLLGRAFSRMTAGIMLQADILSRISQGDYSATIPVRSDKDVMNRAINQMLDSTNNTLSQISSAAVQVSAGSKQIADSAQSLAHGAVEQASSIDELSTSIKDITSKTDKNAKISKEAAALSNAIKEKAEKGSTQMDHMMQAVNEINEASAQIEKVIKAIDDIAFQTNILALNAAVEAARAGSHGKGFAVVAEEVRNLAAKSAESANDTGVMLENSREKANLGLAIATETSESLKDIIDGINRSADIVAQIAQSSDEQAYAISQINSGIEQVSQVVQQNSAASEESAAAAEEMSGQSETLTQLTSKFKLKDSGEKFGISIVN